MRLLSVIVDSREPTWIHQLAFGGADKSIATLDAGDLLAACEDGELLAIERKTPSDFLNTLRDQRLFPQMRGLREFTRWAYLIICGDLRPGPNGKTWADFGTGVGLKETGWTWEAVQGALLTCQEAGVHVVLADGILEYEQTVLRLARRDRTALRLAPPREVALLSDQEQVLAALPGIGAERAKALLAYCGSPAWALQCLTDERNAQPVPGIGRGIKRLVRDALQLEDDQSLYVLTSEAAGEAPAPAPPPTIHQPERELAGVAA